MFKFRTKPDNTAFSRQLLPVLQITASSDQLPLKNEVTWEERWCTLPKGFELIFERLYDFKIRPEDIFVEGFMKSGTTWMHEAIWQLMNGLDLDYTKTKGELRRHFLEFNGMFVNCEDRITKFAQLPGPRLFQTHLPVNLLPKEFWVKKPKTIYVARNVKDVVVSAYHFVQWMGMWRGTIDEYVQDFINDDAINTPFWPHVVDFWQLRHEPHIYFVTYEEMQRDLTGVIRKLCDFLERPQLTEFELKALVEHLSFEKMKSNDKANPTASIKKGAPHQVDPNLEFMRRGIIGSYKDELSEENQRLLNEWTSKSLEKYGITEEDIFDNF